MERQNNPKIILVNRCLIRNSCDELLLVQRSLERSHNPGLWEFPGGKLETGQNTDESLRREVLEETGLFIEPETDLTYTESYIIPDGIHRGSTYVAIFGIARAIGGNLRLSDEHKSFAWEPYHNVHEYDLTQQSRKALVTLGHVALRLSNSCRREIFSVKRTR